MTTFKKITCSAMLIAALVLAACGGGGDEEVDATDDTTTDQAADAPEDSDEADEAEAGNAPEGEIVIASRGGRFTESTVEALAEPFTAETGIEVVVVDNPVGMVSQIEAMTEAGQVQWDILDSASSADAFYLYEQGLAAPLSDELRASLEAVLGADRVTEFGFPWSAYGFVLVCNNETVETCPDDSTGLYDAEQYPGSRMNIGMPSSYSHLITFLGLAAGNPVDAPLPVDLDEAADILRGIRDDTRVWWTAGEQMEQAIRQGEVDMGIMFSGRAFSLIDEGMDLEIVWNKGVYSPGYYLRIEGGPNPEAADLFLEWIASNPEAQAQWAEMMQYSVPHPDALGLVNEETAPRLVDRPELFEQLAPQDIAWYLENRSEIDSMLESVIAGG